MVSLGEALAQSTRVLAEAGVEQPGREARLIASHLIGASVTALSDAGRPVDAAALATLVARRAAREPLALITGRRGFWTLDLAVSPDTLVPRPDSETLIEAALASFPSRERVRSVLDLGTGTGCLLLAALSEFPAAWGLGIDVSPSACRLAAGNADACGLADRAWFAAGDWCRAVLGTFDLVLCNPPYIATADLAQLMPEVRLHEPGRALDGGSSGLAAYTQILPGLPALLTSGGLAILELGQGQEADVLALAEQAGLTHMMTRSDLGRVARALVLRRPPP